MLQHTNRALRSCPEQHVLECFLPYSFVYQVLRFVRNCFHPRELWKRICFSDGHNIAYRVKSGKLNSATQISRSSSALVIPLGHARWTRDLQTHGRGREGKLIVLFSSSVHNNRHLGSRTRVGQQEMPLGWRPSESGCGFLVHELLMEQPATTQ